MNGRTVSLSSGILGPAFKYTKRAAKTKCPSTPLAFSAITRVFHKPYMFNGCRIPFALSIASRIINCQKYHSAQSRGTFKILPLPLPLPLILFSFIFCFRFRFRFRSSLSEILTASVKIVAMEGWKHQNFNGKNISFSTFISTVITRSMHETFESIYCDYTDHATIANQKIRATIVIESVDE